MARQLREVMTMKPVTVDVHDSAADAARSMRDNDTGAMLVCEDGSLRGVLTDRDIVVRALADGRDPKKTEVGEIYSSEVEALSPTDDVETAVKLMRSRHVRRVPVVEGSTPVGIVSIGDLALERDESSVLAEISGAPANQ